MSATDAQVQQYANERIRVRAEQFRALINSCRDDLAAITDVYARANGGDPWADARTDGPPKLLESTDVLVFNAFITQFLNCIDNTPDAGSDNTLFVLHANLAPFQAACVRPVSQSGF